MPTDPIPDDVRRFILMSIDSIAQMEALLLLRDKPQEEWDTATIARRLYISEQETSDVLTRLCAQGLLYVNGSPAPRYQYQPQSTEMEQMVNRVADVYTKHLVSVTNLIHAKPRTRIQEFADAFKLRKEE